MFAYSEFKKSADDKDVSDTFCGYTSTPSCMSVLFACSSVLKFVLRREAPFQFGSENSCDLSSHDEPWAWC
jgi:hypothetical protein